MSKQQANEWAKPKEVSLCDMLFTGDVIGTLLPKKEDIPKEFYDHHNKWTRIASSFFFKGGQLPPTRDCISRRIAVNHIQTVLASFQPQHEHKEAGVGYLLSMWCTATSCTF